MVFFVYPEPISRILYPMRWRRLSTPISRGDSHLSGLVITYELKRHYPWGNKFRKHNNIENVKLTTLLIKSEPLIPRVTALHLSKDLAVSPLYFYRIPPRGRSSLSASTSLLAPLGLLRTGVTRYPSTVAERLDSKCSDFPPREITKRHL